MTDEVWGVDSSNFSNFLDHLQEKVTDNIRVADGKVGTVEKNSCVSFEKETEEKGEGSFDHSLKEVPPKCWRVQWEKVYPPITLLGYTWVNEEVDTFFSYYNKKLDIEDLLSWLTVCTINKDRYCLITLQTC